MKTKQVIYGIEITKPWSKAMYAHNDKVAKIVTERIKEEWANAVERAEEDWNDFEAYEEEYATEFLDADWEAAASGWMQEVQSAVTMYGFGMGFTVEMVQKEVLKEIEVAAYWRLKQIAEELEFELEQEFIGLK